MIYFDLEATGIDPQYDRITQVAVVRDDGSTYLQTVNPGRPIPPIVAELTGITDEMVATCPRFTDIAEELAEALRSSSPAVAYNPGRLDLPILAAEFDRAGVPFDWSTFEVIDVYGLESVANPRTLSAVYARLFARPLADAHGALADAIATRDVFAEIVHRYPTLRGKTAAELALLSNHGRKRADPAGKLSYDAAGRLCYAFGQHKGTPVADQPGYAEWMLTKDFPPSTCDLLLTELRRIDAEARERNPQDRDPAEIPF